jgi:hypothetical protein
MAMKQQRLFAPLPIYIINTATKMDEFDKQEVKRELDDRLERYIESATNEFIEEREGEYPYADIERVAYENVGYNLRNDFEAINSDYELINVNPEDEEENYLFQLGIIKERANELLKIHN